MHKQWIKDGLSEYLSDAHAVWHMPGHKRKACYGDFQDTIYNNISMGKPDATEEEVYEAARKARCYDFIMARLSGYSGQSKYAVFHPQRVSHRLRQPPF